MRWEYWNIGWGVAGSRKVGAHCSGCLENVFLIPCSHSVNLANHSPFLVDTTPSILKCICLSIQPSTPHVLGPPVTAASRKKTCNGTWIIYKSCKTSFEFRFGTINVSIKYSCVLQLWSLFQFIGLYQQQNIQYWLASHRRELHNRSLHSDKVIEWYVIST